MRFSPPLRRAGWAALCGLFTLLGPSVGGSQPRARGDTAARAARPIRAVEVQRLTVFDSAEARFWPYRIANALHATTRAYVVRRELLFAPGEAYDTARVNESVRNLRALGIFRYVEADSIVTDSGLIARVRTADAWTTTPSFDVSTSGSQTVFSLSLQESNLLGTRTAALLSYQNDPDRSSILAAFDSPRAIRNRVGLGASYVDRSDGRASAASVRYPFFSLSSRYGAFVAGQFSQGRLLRFVAGRVRANLTLHREFSIARMDAAKALSAGPNGYIHLGVAGQIRREDYILEKDAALIPRTVTAALGPYLEARAPHYIQVRNVMAMDRVEDVDLGFRVHAGVLVAPAAWGYARGGAGASLGFGIGHRVPSGYAQLEGSASGLRDSNGIDSSTASVGGTIVMQPVPRLLLVGHAAAGRQKNTAPGAEFDLGLGRGVRAFPSHSFTGDRAFVLNAESRWLVWSRLFGLVGVGAAAFADHAGAWFAGSPRRTGTDAGVGLRLASIREAGSVWRLDWSRRAANDIVPSGWVVSIGRGFVF